MRIHFTDLQKLYPHTPKSVLEASVAPLNQACARFDISTGTRIAAFIAQVGHESMGFARLQENLNYDAAGLLKVFPKYFNRDLAQAYARKPQKIGSRVYANRMGNGNEASGEGYKYRGRGFIQLTGKATYKLFALFCEMTVADALLYLETREGAAYSAGWYWAINNLNDLADLGKFKTITQRINGGQNGAADREAHFKLAKHLFD